MAEKRTDKTLFYLPNGRGFTLIELLVVIAIIGLLASLSMIALNSAREKSRNSRRVSDMKQVQTALEMRFNDVHSYPDDITFGDDQITNGLTGSDKKVYMDEVPANPKPWNEDGTCPDQNYSYTTPSGIDSTYTIQYCISEDTGEIDGGKHTATPAGISTGTWD